MAPNRWLSFLRDPRYRVHRNAADASLPMAWLWGYYADLLAELDAPGDSEWTFDELSRADSATRFAGHLELIVGPYVRSRGMGPFAPVPRCAARVVDGDEDLGCWFVEPSRVQAALDELSATSEHAWFRPSLLRSRAESRRLNDIARADLGTDLDVDWGKPHPHDWLGWSDVKSAWSERCADRYRTFLLELRDSGDVGRFTYWLPDDQGTNVAPLGDDAGELVDGEHDPIRR